MTEEPGEVVSEEPAPAAEELSTEAPAEADAPAQD